MEHIDIRRRSRECWKSRRLIVSDGNDEYDASDLRTLYKNPLYHFIMSLSLLQMWLVAFYTSFLWPPLPCHPCKLSTPVVYMACSTDYYNKITLIEFYNDEVNHFLEFEFVDK